MLPKWNFVLLPLCLFALCAASSVVANGSVTLQSLTIYNTHEWFWQKPEVYFQCDGEDRIALPDIKEKNQLYKFRGQESWQPLVTLEGIKCKRCGLYERDHPYNQDDIFDQWELCPLDFNPNLDGHYYRFKEGEFNLTLSCLICNDPGHHGTQLYTSPPYKAG